MPALHVRKGRPLRTPFYTPKNAFVKLIFLICEHVRGCVDLYERFYYNIVRKQRKAGYVISGESRTYYYARVSTKDQNLDRQLAAFRALGAVDDRYIITDKESGKDTDRPGYQALKTTILRRGDTLVIKSLDRLSRKKKDIKAELEYFRDAGIKVRIIDLPTTMVEFKDGQEWVLDMVNNIIIEVLGTIAEREREETLQRQKEGIVAAKAQGRSLGRKAAQYPPNWDEIYEVWREGNITAVEAMRRAGVKKTTFYKLVKQMERDIAAKNSSRPEIKCS